MQTVLLVVHLIVAVALIGVILLQKSSQDGSNLAGGGTMGGLFTAKGSANLLTRTTAILATIFICCSLALAYLAGNANTGKQAIEMIGKPQWTAQPAPVTPPTDAPPVTPEVPMAR